MMEKPKVGDKLFIVNRYYNYSPFNPKGKEVIVSRVGKKYFYLKIHKVELGVRFKLEDWKQDTKYTANYVLYKSEKDYKNQITKEKLADGIQAIKYFDLLTIDLDKLKKVADLLDVKYDKEKTDEDK